MRLASLPDDRYPAVSDLRERAHKRMPHMAWEYLDSATGREEAALRNETALSRVELVPRFMQGEISPNPETMLFGRNYAMPAGIAPVGLTSLMWPGAEQILARTAASENIPWCMSTLTADTPEVCGPLASGNGWFQLYPPRDPQVRKDLLKRVTDSGFSALVVTADVPAPSMRERQRRAGISMPPKTTPKMLYRMLKRPAWLAATLKRGRPRFLTMEKYADGASMADLVQYVGTQLGGILDWDYIKAVREEWDGPLIIKGILAPDDAKAAVKAGAEGVWVSNHGGRQFDGAPASIEALPPVVKAVNGKASILFDSGVRSGLDVLRAVRLGADFVFLGRPFIYGVGALGDKGGTHVAQVIAFDMINNMHQLGVRDLDELMDIEVRTGP